MLHSSASQMIPLPELGSHSSNSCVFMCMSCQDVGGTRTPKRRLLLGAFIQHVDSSFQYLNDKDGLRKQHNDYTIHKFGKSF